MGRGCSEGLGLRNIRTKKASSSIAGHRGTEFRTIKGTWRRWFDLEILSESNQSSKKTVLEYEGISKARGRSKMEPPSGLGWRESPSAKEQL